jgi:hypothetical protein
MKSIVEVIKEMPLDEYGYVQTQAGKPVKLLHKNIQSAFPIIGIVKEKDGVERSRSWQADGNSSGNEDSDLVPVSKKISAWVNVYEEYPRHSFIFHSTKQKADHAATPGRIACIEISGEEGEGL